MSEGLFACASGQEQEPVPFSYLCTSCACFVVCAHQCRRGMCVFCGPVWVPMCALQRMSHKVAPLHTGENGGRGGGDHTSVVCRHALLQGDVV